MFYVILLVLAIYIILQVLVRNTLLREEESLTLTGKKSAPHRQ